MQTDEAQHETKSVPFGVTQVAKADSSSKDAELGQHKRTAWKKVVGWTLYSLGLLGGLGNTVLVVVQGYTPSTFAAAAVVSFPFCCVGLWLVYGGTARPSREERVTVANRASSSAGTSSALRGVTSASGSARQRPRLARCPLCRSTTFHVVEDASSRRCSNCHSVLPAYIQGNETDRSVSVDQGVVIPPAP